MNKTKNQTATDREDAEQRLLKGLAMVLAALPELLWNWLVSQKKKPVS